IQPIAEPTTHLRPLIFHSTVHSQDPHSFPTRRSSDLVSTDTSEQRQQGLAAPGQDYYRLDETLSDDEREIRDRVHQFADREVVRSEEHTSELQSPYDLVCRLLLEKKTE